VGADENIERVYYAYSLRLASFTALEKKDMLFLKTHKLENTFCFAYFVYFTYFAM
jgi:hypothetical protein